MEETWASRDLPVLEAAVELVDEMYPTGTYPEGRDVAARAGIGIDSVATALNALDGEFLDLQRTGEPSAWGVPSVTPAARRAAGQWPTGESLIERLATGIGEAAENEQDPDRRARLRQVAAELGGMARAVAVNVASQVIGQHVPR